MKHLASLAPLILAFSSLLHADTAVKIAPPPQLATPTMTRDEGGEVTLKSSDAGTTLLYTLDGSEPTAKSNPYLAPITLTGGAEVKARAFTQDRKSSSATMQAKFAPLPDHPALPSTVVAVTQDRSWPSYDWQKRHKATAAAAKKQQPQILFIGDSITHFFGGEQFDGYALRGKNTWDEFYAPRHPSNLGFGWDKTENVLWRLQHGAIDGIAPKVVVMMIGTNNTPNIPAPEIALGIHAIVKELHQRLPQSKLLLLGIFPRGEKPSPQRDKIAEVNRDIAALDGQQSVTYLDIGPKFLTPDGLITKDIMPDFLHPNEKGYRIWAEAMEPTLRKLLGE